MTECEAIFLDTGDRACWQRAAYRAFYKNCRECGPTCVGVNVCIEHGAEERQNPDLIRLVDWHG